LYVDRAIHDVQESALGTLENVPAGHSKQVLTLVSLGKYEPGLQDREMQADAWAPE
jgi:hypothetical protein